MLNSDFFDGACVVILIIEICPSSDSSMNRLQFYGDKI